MGRARRRSELKPSKGGVVIGYARSEKGVNGPFSESLYSVLLHDHLHDGHVLDRGGWIAVTSGPRIAAARNEIVQAFLTYTGQPEWLFMCDTDMIIPPDAIDRLLAVADPFKQPIVGTMCIAGGGGVRQRPTVMRLGEDDQGAIVESVRLSDLLPLGDVVQCDATGTAGVLIHRNVLVALWNIYGEKTVHPWFAETEHNLREFGEDVTFCLRARKAGFPIAVHTGVQLNHEKNAMLTVESCLAYEREVDARGAETLAAEHQKRLTGMRQVMA